MKPKSIKIRILLPLGMALALLLAAFIFISYRSLKSELRTEMERELKTLESSYKGRMDYEARKLSVGLKSITGNREMILAFLKKDREELLKQSAPLFERLRNEDGITHFYFTGPDRINFLRVHQPERYGDRIDRFTMLEAQRTGIESHGIELGPLGTFTLRVVAPWHDGERDIGYIELGLEVGHVIEELQEFLGVKIYTFIHKEFLDRKKWEEGISMLTREGSWDRFPDTVYLGELPGGVPELIADKMALKHIPSRTSFNDLFSDGKYYRISIIPLVDAIGREVGHIAALRNTTNMVSSFRKSNYFISVISIAIGGALMLLFYAIIGKVEKRLETSRQKLIHLSSYDHLTGLANRRLFDDMLTQSILRAERNEQPLALLSVDLDNFKNINDTLGHPIGDMLLVEVAERFQKKLRRSSSISRLGGNEFAITVEDISDHLGASYVARRVIDLLGEVFLLDEHKIFISASVGITIYPNDGEEADTLLKNTETAMYHAKKQGKNNYQFFSAEMNVEMEKRIGIETKLRHALEKDEFTLYYQPKINLEKGMISGMESLIRWYYKGTELISPADFIPVAEETSLILNIDRWVLSTACKQLKIWQEAGYEKLQISVNISGLHFKRGRILETVKSALKETGLNPGCLELEITEGVLMEDIEEAVSTLKRLRSLGINISVDDFGTGYSSLNYLKRFPINKVKIDQSFVSGVTTDPDDAAITRTIIAMAKNLNLSVIAEGVETKEQLDFLHAEGCSEIQGYYFSRPLPADEFKRLLDEWKYSDFEKQPVLRVHSESLNPLKYID